MHSITTGFSLPHSKHHKAYIVFGYVLNNSVETLHRFYVKLDLAMLSFR